MLSTGLSRKPGNLCILLDDRVSRERTALLTRTINQLRTFTTVDVLGEKTTEDQLLKKLEEKPYDLVLLPWHKYLSWSRAEAFWGLTRTSGPTLAAYFCDKLAPLDLGEQKEHFRGIFLDFANLSPKEASVLVQSLQKDTRRCGIKPLLDPDCRIYVENWYGSQGLGSRIDSVLSLPELSDPRWAKRGSSIRICLNALWSLIYEEGPGKADVAHGPTSSPKAYFQVACDREAAVLRLCFQMASWNPRAALTAFWPEKNPPTAASQLLMRYSDFLRVHSFQNTPEVEIVVGFFGSAPAEQAHDQLHTFWVEPLTDHLFTETPYEAPGPANPRLRPLPSGLPQQENKLRAVSASSAPNAGPETVSDNTNVVELKQMLEQKEAVIQELKSGGVGTAPPLPPPDPESLIEAFQERYFDARFQIRQLELEIVAMETRGATDEEIKNIRLKMEALANREQAWIKKLAGTLAVYKQARRK